MKKILLIATLFVSVTLQAQKTQGRVFYDVEITSDNPQMAAMMNQGGTSELELTFMDDKSRAVFDMAGMMTSTTITSSESESSLVLLDGMMGKLAMQPKESDLTEEEKEMTEREVELVDGSKEIIGFDCKKAIVTTNEGDEIIIWYATDLLPSHRKGNMYMMEEIPGLPLEFSTKQGPMNLKFTAYEFSKKVKKPEVLFSMEIPEGYTLKTSEEMRQMQQGR